ncbi:MAG: hypothetical protein M8364_08175 [Methylobacter sp.]|uniref:hypothetical protein n=1 Tax=Methylobacter sp. TaxID=2051955 RepID=UPI002583F8CD|nr:hypothetical protein [Methylobacter sp.]MCL7420863.1 hypothetical protein [Methylobacter sp.]
MYQSPIQAALDNPEAFRAQPYRQRQALILRALAAGDNDAAHSLLDIEMTEVAVIEPDSVSSYGFSLNVPIIGHRESRKVTADQIASYHGIRYRFPDALPGETVFFEHGRPCSATAEAIPQDRFGFDVLPENSATKTDEYHKPPNACPPVLTHDDALRVARFIQKTLRPRRLPDIKRPDPQLTAALARWLAK